MILSNAEKMYAADAAAINEVGIPSTELMSAAAKHVARAALELMGENRSAVIFCGSGNNGGDGVAAAEILLREGVAVRAFLVGAREKMTADTAEMERRLIAAGGKLEPFDAETVTAEAGLSDCGVIIDALFGIGLRRPLNGTALAAVRWINAAGASIVSADIPSGVCADNGQILGEAVRADRTVTFSMAKPGHYLEPGCIYCGRTEVCPIGIPEALLREAETEVSVVFPAECTLPRRSPLAHKGNFGRVLIVGGSVGFSGAPNLAASAAVRSGAGLVYLGVPEAIWPICAVKADEVMPFPLPCDADGRLTEDALPLLRERWKSCDVLALGPGLGRSEGTKAVTLAALREFTGRLVLDADALFALAGETEAMRSSPAQLVITPHMGEFHRLGGVKTGDRLRDAQSFAAEANCITVLKGHHVVIAEPTGKSTIIAAGNAGMARGGSGDALTGIMAALLGQLPTEAAVIIACAIHAAAGDSCAAEFGEYGMTVTDMIAAVPKIMKGMIR